MEAKVRTQRREQHKFNIDDETLCCILDVGSSRAHDTKYHRILKIYWNTKSLLPQVLGEKKFEGMKIQRQLTGIQTQLQLMEHKQDNLAREIWGVEVILTKDGDGSSPNNPINLDSEDKERQLVALHPFCYFAISCYPMFSYSKSSNLTVLLQYSYNPQTSKTILYFWNVTVGLASLVASQQQHNFVYCVHFNIT